MKKVLLASTALVLTAGYAAAEVTVTGSANMGVQYFEDEDLQFGEGEDEFGLHYELDFNVIGSGTTDNGLTFGASLDLDLDDGEESANIDDPEVFIEGTFGRLTFGDVDSASDNLTLGISDVGFDGIGVDDGSDAFVGAGIASAMYTGTFSDFAVVITANPATGSDGENDDFGVGVGYAFGDYEVAAAYEAIDFDNDGDETDVYYLGFQGSVEQFSFDVFYSYADQDEVSAGGVSGAYAVGNGLAITAAIGFNDDDVDGVEIPDLDDEDVDYGIGFEYDLGGAVLAGAVGSVGENVAADLGFNFSF